jgi:hypothetical protein
MESAIRLGDLGYRTAAVETMDSACVLCTYTVSMYTIDTTGHDIPVIYFGLMCFEPLSYSRPLEDISLYLTLKRGYCAK